MRVFCKVASFFTTYLVLQLELCICIEYRFATLGPYCFRISGQVYHLISQLLPADGDVPKFLQIYLYDASD